MNAPTSRLHSIFAAAIAPYAKREIGQPLSHDSLRGHRPNAEERADRELDADDREFAKRVAALLAPGGKFDAADPDNAEYSAVDLIEVAEFQAEEDMFYASLPRAAGQMIP